VNRKKVFEWHSNGKPIGVGVIGNRFAVKLKGEASSE